MMAARARLVWDVNSSTNTMLTGTRSANVVVFCRVVLCCVVLCCVVLCCLVLCRVVSCRVVSCGVMWCGVVSGCAMLCVVLCLCCVVLCLCGEWEVGRAHHQGSGGK